MCRLGNIALHDYQESVTTGQTDTRTDKVIPMCRYASQAKQKLPCPPPKLITKGDHINTELQIILSPIRIYPLIFASMLILKIQGVFSPPIFYCNAEKRRYNCFEVPYLHFDVVLNIALVLICYCLWYYTCIVIYKYLFV